MQAFLEYVVKGLVQNPGAVSVTPVQREGVTVYELRLDAQDVGKIIGRQGRTAAALRTLVALTAEKHGKRAQLDIKD